MESLDRKSLIGTAEKLCERMKMRFVEALARDLQRPDLVNDLLVQVHENADVFSVLSDETINFACAHAGAVAAVAHIDEATDHERAPIERAPALFV